LPKRLGLLMQVNFSIVPTVLFTNAINLVLSTYSDCNISWNPLFPGFKYIPIKPTPPIQRPAFSTNALLPVASADTEKKHTPGFTQQKDID